MDGPMLNLERQEQPLTQGQPPGKRVIARSVQIEEVTVQAAPPANPAEGSPAPASAQPLDAHAVAQRVYELMLADLLSEHARRRPS